jgi:peroxiredoxin
MSRTSASRVKVRAGDQIPSIGLRASDGFLLNLRSFVTRQPVAFLFFGAATMQGAARRTGHRLAESLATGYDRLHEAGIAVVGVSCDNEVQQLEYIAEHKLPYLLFSDERRAAVGALGIPTVSSGDNHNVAAPVVVAVDAEGVVRSVIERPMPEGLVEAIMHAFAEPLPASAADGSVPKEEAPPRGERAPDDRPAGEAGQPPPGH